MVFTFLYYKICKLFTDKYIDISDIFLDIRLFDTKSKCLYRSIAFNYNGSMRFELFYNGICYKQIKTSNKIIEESYYDNGELHKDDGFAQIYYDKFFFTKKFSHGKYYLKGREIKTKSEFDKLVKLKMFW